MSGSEINFNHAHIGYVYSYSMLPIRSNNPHYVTYHVY